jgi:chromosome partitioning protein
MKVLALASQKGGSGKSTLARALGVLAAEDGSATLIDLDPQQTVTRWARNRAAETPTVAQADGKTLSRRLDELARAGTAVAVLDTPPHVKPLMAQVIQVADAMLVPAQPSPDDLHAIGDTINPAKAAEPAPAVGVVLNRCPARAQSVAMARQALAAFDVALAPGTIGDRVAFSYAASFGEAVTEYEPNGKAAREVRELWTWTRGTLLGL